jgi:hypothetical protein
VLIVKVLILKVLIVKVLILINGRRRTGDGHQIRQTQTSFLQQGKIGFWGGFWSKFRSEAQILIG